MNNCYPFELKSFNYDYTSFEPYIDTKTMHLHYSKHLRGYVHKLNELLEQQPQYQNFTLEELCLKKEIPQNIKNQAGGVWNHNFFFDCLINSTKSNNMLSKQPRAIQNLIDEFENKVLSLFGSGYTYFVVNKTTKEIEIINTYNQDIPNLEIYEPILCIDNWEHAYYLKNYNERNKYLSNWFEVINWEKVKNNYEKGLSEKT